MHINLHDFHMYSAVDADKNTAVACIGEREKNEPNKYLMVARWLLLLMIIIIDKYDWISSIASYLLIYSHKKRYGDQ